MVKGYTLEEITILGDYLVPSANLKTRIQELRNNTMKRVLTLHAANPYDGPQHTIWSSEHYQE